MAGKIITLNKDEVTKVVELARGYLMTFEINYICHSLFKGIENVKNIENDYVPKHIDEYDYRLIYNEDNFLFNGDVWFNSYDTSMKNLRIKLLTLYLNELKKENNV